MTLVLDTNVVVSAFLWSGSPSILLSAARIGKVDLITSFELIRELESILSRKKFEYRLKDSPLSAQEIVDRYTELAIVFSPSWVAPTCHDPNDDMVLAAARASGATLIVSGDHHLLSLGNFDGTPIVPVREALLRAGLLE